MLTPSGDAVYFSKICLNEHKERCNETETKKGIKLLRMKQFLREVLEKYF